MKDIGLARLLGRPDPRHLPERVRARIREQQASSEVLIGWIQLGVVGVFGALYAIAPKTFSPDATFAPVPWVLGAYLVFTVTRLTLAYQRRLPDWFLYLSVAMDMLLLLGLIWSFHLQYRQPPSFYLKAPTLLYVFIFIALRTLHFEVRYVSLAGVIAATGWLGLVLYVVASNSSGSMVTRDYVEYMTSNSVLLGAEFDKIMSILTVTLILAVAIARARRLLVRSVADAEAVQQLSRFVPTEVADSVKEAGELRAGTGVLREATILFVDLEGFTTLSESMSPTKVISILNDYFAAVSAPIEAEGGVINQFQGDAILASFNLPASNPEHAAAAVRAALQILELLRHRVFHGERLQARVGLNSGTVIGGLVGTGTRLSYTVHGDDVNLAARLEQLNKRHATRLLLSERTCELAGWDNFPFRRIGVDKVRGRSKALTVFTLDGPGKTDGGDG